MTPDHAPPGGLVEKLGHHHLRPSSARERAALRRALILTASLLIIEVIGGFWAHSLALLSDAAHMLTDFLALALSGAAIGFASRPASKNRTFGFYRLEILSALANGILLAVLAGGILVEAYNRFGIQDPVRLGILAPVALAGLCANLVSFWWLSRARGGISTRAALWHVGADGASSLLVLLAAGVMALTSWWWVDAAVSAVLASIMIWGAFRLLRESLEILLEASPREIDLERVESRIQEVTGVDGVHDLHIWSLTSEVHALSGHLRVQPEKLSETDRIITDARKLLENSFGITHTTLQVESEACGEVVCILRPTDPFDEASRSDGTRDSG